VKHGARAWAVVGVLVVAGARLAIPGAPALYEGPIGPTEPYHYCKPPANLASTNKLPTSGAGELLLTGDSNVVGSYSTTDNQVLTFWPKGSLQAPGATRIQVSITPNCANPPAPPGGSTLVGNTYDVTVLGNPGNIAVTFVPKAQVQVLLRTPPVQYSSIQLFYDGAWHPVQWGPQGDIANIWALDHAGSLAAIYNGSKAPPAKPSGSGIVVVVEVVLVAAAVGIVGAAIFVQRRRVDNIARGAEKGLERHEKKQRRGKRSG
jgi:hypothetical protein